MAENPTDLVPHILLKIQDSISALRSEVGQFRRENETQHVQTQDLIRKQRRDAAGMMVIMRATVSDFEERVSAVEQQLALLDPRTSRP
jgi:hypothetical protein